MINRLRIVCALAGAIVAVALPAAANGAAKPRLYSFGLNFEGEMGITTNATNVNANPTPVRVRLTGATGAPGKVAAAGTNSFVITASNQLYGFGSNLRGQLGIAANVDTANANPIPTVVTLPGAGGKILQVAGGNAHTLAITSSGQLYAFGVNVYGQLGIPTNSGTANSNPTPAPVALPGAVGHPVQVATGFMHSIVLTSAGEIYSFGVNNDGQLGIATNSGTNNVNSTPTQVMLPGAVGTVTRIGAGEYTGYAITSSGQLFAWGTNYDGELGSTAFNGTNQPNPPAQVVLPGATGPVVQVVGGFNFTLVLTSTGQLYAFGSNKRGQLGIATNSGTDNPNPSPQLVALPGATGRIIAISAGEVYSMALTSTGELYGFGDNHFGELGTSTNAGTVTPNPTPTRVHLPQGAKAVAVAAGTGDQTLVIAIVPPALSKLKIAPQRFRVSHGAVITYRDSAAARTTLTVSRKVHGKLHRLGALTHHDHAGRNSVSFSGRVAGHALAVGGYVLVVAPAGGKPHSVTFKILA